MPAETSTLLWARPMVWHAWAVPMCHLPIRVISKHGCTLKVDVPGFYETKVYCNSVYVLDVTPCILLEMCSVEPQKTAILIVALHPTLYC